MKRYYWLLALILLISLPQSACGSSGAGPHSWLDRPLDQTHHPLETIKIMAHASSDIGVASFSITIDGEVIHQDSVSGGRLEKTETVWTPPEPGKYIVGASASDKNGNHGSEATSVIYIGGVGDVSSPFDPYGECEGVEYIEMVANPISIPPGECTALFWEVIAPEEWPVFVHGEPVEHVGEIPICLNESTAVELNVETETGMCKKWNFVEVNPVFYDDYEPELNVYFEGSPPVIHRGECSLLHWEVYPPEGEDTILQGQPVDARGEVEVCPEESTIYELIAVRNESEMVSIAVIEVLDSESPPDEEQLTNTPEVEVTNVPAVSGVTPTVKDNKKKSTPVPPAADTTPPKIKNASVTPKDFVYNTNGSCSPTSFKFSVKVSDAGGIASVKLNWTGSGVRSGPASMNKSGGSYVKSLGQFVNTGRLKGFSIKATDKSGNTSQIKTNWKLDVEQCGGG